MHPRAIKSDFQLHKSFTDLVRGEHHNPHSLLGIHPYIEGQKIIRLWRPGAEAVFLEVFGVVVPAYKTAEEGLFEYVVPGYAGFEDYRVYDERGILARDPYAFFPTFGEMDEYLFASGVHYQLYKVMGGRLTSHQGVSGVKFAVWAPSAKAVSIIGDFNGWNGRINPMRAIGSSGVFEIFLPGLEEGEKYKFEIKTLKKEVLVKSDPYALSSEMRPATASVVANIDRFQWQDQEWVKKRSLQKDRPFPMNVYEVHLGSWKRKEGSFLNYREAAVELSKYCRSMGYTHVELLPIAEHPLDESWGYQVSGFYAPTSRFGTPEDFQWFVNYMHQNDIGVILDWVPGHFPKDAHSLGCFDGTSLYEHQDPRQGHHPHWHTHIFNFGRNEVSNFLIANALFWLEKMHIDGLRVDAVASMLYLDYGRKPGEWIPNVYGSHENLEAVDFLKHLNSIVHKRMPGTLMIAEESTSFGGVTTPVDDGGLGFDLKWNMGWMNDTLRYFSKDSLFRHHHHNDLTFGLLYAFSERFALVFSHDEVVHGKKSLIGKMPGDIWQKFANLRLLLSYMMCQPGKKLLFMGGEIAQWNEWTCKQEIEWELLKFPAHHSIQTMTQELNHFYLASPALWERDFDHSGFEWVDFGDTKNSVFSYLRKSQNQYLLCVHNFTPQYHSPYVLSLGNVASIQEVFNTDAEKYGGSGKLNQDVNVFFDKLEISVAPLATMIFDVKFHMRCT